jgi:CBS domain-containing protein
MRRATPDRHRSIDEDINEERQVRTKNPQSTETSATNPAEAKHDTNFVGKMFSGFGHENVLRPEHPPAAAEEPYRALRQSTSPAGGHYHLPSRERSAHVRPGSPATEVMTDFTRVVAATILPGATVDEANEVMIRRGVRSLFVLGESRGIAGIVTATDTLGERPVQFAHERGLRHAEVLVHHVMTPAAHLEAIELRDVLQARVGDIVETLKRSGRQHALVIEDAVAGPDSAERTVRGMFSLTQIARQLGLPPHVGGVAKTFAEIEAAIAG